VSFRRFAFLVRLCRKPWLLAGIVILLAGLSVAGYWGNRQLSAWHHLHAAEQALDRYHPAKAREHLESCLECWPNDPRTHLLAARAARQAGDLDAAYRLLKEYAALPDADEQTHGFELILLRAASGDVNAVEEHLFSLVEQNDPRSAAILEALAAGYLRTYRQREVMLCLQLWLDREPDCPQALFVRGQVAQRLHAYGPAAEDFTQVVKLDPERDDARLRLVQCLLEKGEPARAREQLEILKSRRPDDPDVLSRLAAADIALDRFAEAAGLLDGVLADHPRFVLALRLRGEVALKTGQAAAEDWLKQAVALAPYDREANLDLEQCLKRLGKTAEAKAAAQRRRQLEADLLRVNEIATKRMPDRPRDVALHCELGLLLLRIGHEDTGVRWLLSAVALDSSCTAAHRALAAYYAAHGEPELAAQHRKRAQH
jgi:tetratricopeptide (TPR) repeat protein